MKKYLISLYLMGISVVLLLFMTSCKNITEDKNVIKETAIEEKSNTFDITVDLKIKKDDDLIIYYKDGSNEWIVEEKSVWNTVKGSNDFQKVVFQMPEGVLPNDFRFDIGRNEYKGQEPVEIRSISLNYINNSFVVTQEMLNNFFKPNQFIKYNEDTNEFLFNEVEGNYDPFFEVTPQMYSQLTKLVLND